MTPKHIPLRTCVQCRTVRAKRDLVRVVRSPQGSITVDERGKAPGRGAYVCRCRSCLTRAIEQRRLDHALKAQLGPEEQQRLLSHAEGWPDELSSVEPQRD